MCSRCILLQPFYLPDPCHVPRYTQYPVPSSPTRDHWCRTTTVRLFSFCPILPARCPPAYPPCHPPTAAAAGCCCWLPLQLFRKAASPCPAVHFPQSNQLQREPSLARFPPWSSRTQTQQLPSTYFTHPPTSYLLPAATATCPTTSFSTQPRSPPSAIYNCSPLDSCVAKSSPQSSP